MERFVKNAKKFIRTFPRKHHVEYITALLSIPVLLSVVALNVINLQNNSKKEEQTPVPPQQQNPIIVEVNPSENQDNNIPTPNPEICRKEIGPISITSPQEDDEITDDHVCVNIRYADSAYCSVIWSYRINNGTWSEYNNNSPCIYNLTDGDVKFELRVQSTVSQDTEILERNFIYKSQSVTPIASPTQQLSE